MQPILQDSSETSLVKLGGGNQHRQQGARISLYVSLGSLVPGWRYADYLTQINAASNGSKLHQLVLHSS